MTDHHVIWVHKRQRPQSCRPTIISWSCRLPVSANTHYDGSHCRTRHCLHIQGPPATGKTTTIANLLANAVELIDSRSDRVVCNAEINEAVHVMAECFRKVFDELHGENAAIAKIVIIDTEAKRQHARLSGRPVRFKIKPMRLVSQVELVANSDAKYALWLQADFELKPKGRIPHNKLLKAYTRLSRRLVALIKATNPMCLAPMATIHCRNPFFFGYKDVPSFKCSLFVRDEASQVTAPSWAQGVTVLNPTAVILCGDHQQLATYVKSGELLPELRISILEKHIKKGAPTIMLDVEYRSRPEIFCGTNVHYGNKVKVANKILASDSAFYTSYMQNIGRVSFRQVHVEADGRHWTETITFSHNVHFVNITDGRCEKIGLS